MGNSHWAFHTRSQRSISGRTKVRNRPRLKQAAKGAIRVTALDLDFRGEATGYGTHSLHPYPAKFIPQLPNTLIREFTNPGDTVADIFCGSGTTLVEALLLGRNAIGVDANPLACLISTAKTTRFEAGDREVLRELALRAEEFARTIEGDGKPTLWRTEPFASSAWRPEVDAISFWFEPFVIEELAEVLSWCKSLKSERQRVVALAAFSAIVVNVSKQDSDTRYVRRVKRIAPGFTTARFARSLRAAVDALQSFGDQVSRNLTCQVRLASVLDKPNVGTFDFMVCSPPYPNAYSYHLYHMTRMLWLGFDQARFKKEEIGSHRKYSRKGPNGATADTFAAEMKVALSWVSQRLKPDGVACFVIGDSIIRGNRIGNADLLAEVARHVGYEELGRRIRRLETTKKAFNPAIGKIKEETVLILQNERGHS